MASFSCFYIDGEKHPIEEILDFLKQKGYEVKRSIRTDYNPAEYETEEKGYLIVGTDVTIADPSMDPDLDIPTYEVFKPFKGIEIEISKGEEILITEERDKVNKSVYNKLKRKFEFKDYDQRQYEAYQRKLKEGG